uniref:Uncharacterized protein n=1 Tax=Arundo donax TaxID=35708 RepID=A0A0A9BJL1_ARUDO
MCSKNPFMLSTFQLQLYIWIKEVILSWSTTTI